MITFLICFAVLVGAYFIYGHYLERTIGADPDREPPCRSRYDGVDYLPLPKWKTFLIQLLNIAGLGPIFGALLGAMYGPVAFLWITLGGILIGGLHDYVSGMISMKMGGLSLPEIVGRYLGPVMKQSMRAVTLLLMVLVGAVFLVGPAGTLIQSRNYRPGTGIISKPTPRVSRFFPRCSLPSHAEPYRVFTPPSRRLWRVACKMSNKANRSFSAP